jgi:hypothetical protein
MTDPSSVALERAYKYLQGRLESLGYHGWAHDMDAEIESLRSATPANARAVLEEVADALDRALGDTDITHIEDDEELRDQYPVQWACTQVNLLLQSATLPEAPQPATQRSDPADIKELAVFWSRMPSGATDALSNAGACRLARAYLDALDVINAAPISEKQEIPAELYDGMAVYVALGSEKTMTIRPHMVADVLDAVVRLIRKNCRSGNDSSTGVAR